MSQAAVDRIRPFFMYGTAWKEDATQGLVSEALRAGFRAIDTANQRKHYHEAGVGAALLEAYDQGVVTREELFLQTKFTVREGQDHRLPYDPRADYATQVEQSLASSLEHLHTDVVDAYLHHGPLGRSGLNQHDWEIWRAMEGLHEDGRVGALGISNVSWRHLEQLLAGARVKPSFVQNRRIRNSNAFFPHTPEYRGSTGCEST